MVYLTQRTIHRNFDTNSTKYDILNKLFIVANGTKTPDNVLHFNLFSPGPVSRQSQYRALNNLNNCAQGL